MSNDDHNSAAIVAEDFCDLNNQESLPGEGHRRSVAFLLGIIKRVRRVAWYLFKKMAYFLFLLAAVAVLLIGVDKAAELALKRTPLAHVYPENFAMVKTDFTRPVSHYDYDLNPGVCILHNQIKGNRYEYTNNAGFRDPRPISMKKPDDEFRIFLTGGSTAFGLGAAGKAGPATGFYYIEHRETIAHILERILNATAPIPGKTIRVYNTAVWGYAYQHLLFRYVTKLRQYKPDLVVSLDGANELHPASVPTEDWDYFSEGQFNGILRQMFSYNGPGLGSYLTLWLKNNTFLMTFVWKGMDPSIAIDEAVRMHRGLVPGKNAQDSKPSPPSEDRSRVLGENLAAVVRVLEDYHGVLENDGVPHIFALQPLLSLSKKPRHEMETKVESLEEHKQYYDVLTESLYKVLIEQITESAQRKGYFLADFSEYFDDTSEWVFSDWCHLTAGANYLMAKELANLIKGRFFQKQLAEGDKIDSKDGFFGKPAFTGSVVYAPPADDPENGPKNILTRFPGRQLYSSESVPPEERLEVVVDLGREFTLSRLRLVWDDDSVPEEWVVEISPDGEKWNPWIKGGDKELDNFSWWPGYEYYGAEPIQARFLRYVPIKAEDRSIRIRSLNVYR
ncbi:MAG: discoidin domain-containing protein [Candidatus Brocadiia bacterium]